MNKLRLLVIGVRIADFSHKQRFHSTCNAVCIFMIHFEECIWKEGKRDDLLIMQAQTVR